MKKKIKHLFIILTPLQKVVIYQLFGDVLNRKDSLVLLSTIVDENEIFCKKEKLTNYEFSRRKLFTKPLKYLKSTRLNVQDAKGKIENLKNKYKFYEELEIVLGTDKDMFTQLFLNNLYKFSKKHHLTLVDEGIGFYMNLNFKDKVLSIIYRLITPILFGSRLYYIRRIGVYPKIDKIYLRAPELLESKIKGIKYIKFNLKNKNNVKSKIAKGNVLLYSFPNQDGNISFFEKVSIITDIANHLLKFDRNLTIKPHPRENIIELKKELSKFKNVQILDNKFSGEYINYFNYELIINFFSSIIIDLLDKDYPKEKILTIGFSNKPRIHFDKSLKYCYLKNFNASVFINFDLWERF